MMKAKKETMNGKEGSVLLIRCSCYSAGCTSDLSDNKWHGELSDPIWHQGHSISERDRKERVGCGASLALESRCPVHLSLVLCN